MREIWLVLSGVWTPVFTPVFNLPVCAGLALSLGLSLSSVILKKNKRLLREAIHQS